MCFNRSKKNFGGWFWRAGRVGYGEKTHVKEVMEDRTVSVRGNRVAEECAKHPSIDGLGQELKMTIDGMDQAKFKVPRNTASSADLEPLWRPQLHVCGVIVHGHMECYFTMDSDRAKDSNMNCTVMSRVLDLVREKNPPEYALPRSLIVAADNTAREGKISMLQISSRTSRHRRNLKLPKKSSFG